MLLPLYSNMHMYIVYDMCVCVCVYRIVLMARHELLPISAVGQRQIWLALISFFSLFEAGEMLDEVNQRQQLLPEVVARCFLERQKPQSKKQERRRWDEREREGGKATRKFAQLGEKSSLIMIAIIMSIIMLITIGRLSRANICISSCQALPG